MKILKLCGLFLAASTTVSVVCVRSVYAEGTQANSSIVTGDLVNKGENWIEVRVDGHEEVTSFRAPWIGGLPNMGGGPDKQVIEQIKKLSVPSRVKVAWNTNEGPRVLAVMMIDKPTEPPKPPQNPGTETGISTGNLVGKGENYVDVKVDGREDITKFRVLWIGGAPNTGGGYDKKVIEQIKKLVVPSRVRIAWKISEGPRVLAVEMIDKPVEPPKPPITSGQARGIVMGKGEKYIDIKTEGETRRFMPRWIGGANGGLDKDMLHLIAQAPIGAKVKYAWIFDEHLRITALAADNQQ